MKRSIGIFVYPDFQILDASGPASVFEVADHFSGEDRGYQIQFLSLDGGLVRSSGGVAVDTVASNTFTKLDTLMVAGGNGARPSRHNPAICQAINQLAAKSRRLASVCSGTFLLAAAGLIAGCHVTTHWRVSSQLQQLYPSLKVSPDKIWVRDGKVWSSAGVSAGIDLALALVADDYGERVAKQSAREIVVYYQRPGGQSQFSTIEELGNADNRFKPVLAWIRENIAHPIKVERLAEVAAMSPRNFSRQFQKTIGRTPAKAVEQIRVEEAKNLVESTELTLEQIANRCGFSDGEIMRRAFVRLFGRAPRAMRVGQVS